MSTPAVSATRKSLFDRMLMSLRICGGTLGLVVLAIGIIFLVLPGSTLNVRTVINSIYQIIFGALMLLAECRVVRLLKYTYFLQHFIGLGMFYIFVGGLCLGGDWWQYIVAAVAFGIGLVYFVLGLGCRRMGKENFQLSGLRTAETLQASSGPGHAVTITVPASAANAASAAAIGGSAYDNGSEPGAAPAAIRDVRAHAASGSTYSNDQEYAY